ncbi:MAG: hypothetical protein QXP59_07325 [Saccharolobus sp.]
MNLTDKELQRLKYLVGKRKIEGLTPVEEKEVRELVSKQQNIQPDAQIGDVIAIALIIIGVTALIAALLKK